MVCRCCVPGCRNTIKDAKMHRFPYLQRDVYDVWVLRVGNPKLKELEPSHVNKSYRVCHSHFSEHCSVPFAFNRTSLKERSLPTIGLPDFKEPSTMENSILPTSVSLNSERYLTKVTAVPEANMINMTVLDESVIVPEYQENKAQTPATPVATKSCNSEVCPLEVTPSTCGADNNFKCSSFEICSTPKSRKDFRKCKGFLQSVSVKRSKQLTPKARKLYRIASNLKKISTRLFKEKVTVKEKIKLATDFTQTEEYLRCTVNKTTVNFILSQIKQQPRSKKGRRFTMEDKIFALSLYKNSPKNYRLLERVFALPSRFTIQKLLHTVPLRTGINTTVMNSLAKKVAALKKEDRYCVVCWDEIHLTPSLQYNQQFHHIEGFEDVGGGNRRLKFADHALVFMACGIRRKWKQPLCFYFVEGSMKTDDLTSTIKNVITCLQNTGLKVAATVCDQLATNTAAISKLRNETNTLYLRENKENRNFGFEINGQEIIPLYDPPHLLKGIRNNMLKADVIFEWKDRIQKASWKDIVFVYENDEEDSDLKMFYKLTDSHVYEEKMKKMKVNIAAQVFSQRVSAIMRGLQKLGTPNMPSSTGDTANFLLFVDKLFDSCNGASVEIRNGKELRCAISEKSNHHKFWIEAVRVLRSIRFIRNGVEFVPPTVKNWISTIRGMQYLWKNLKIDFPFLCPRNLNQDPLENFFSSVRSQGARNVNPTCAYFRQCFTTLLVNNFFTPLSPNSNCEDDGCEGALDRLSSFVNGEETLRNDAHTSTVKIFASTINEDVADNSGLSTYVAGHMARQLLKTIGVCKHCSQNMRSQDRSGNRSWLINVRAFSTKALLNPSTEFGSLFKKYCLYFRKQLEDCCHFEELDSLLMQLFEKDDFVHFMCPKHNVYELFSKHFFNFYLYVWTKNVNQTLKGLDEKKSKKYYGKVRLLASKKYSKSRKLKS